MRCAFPISVLLACATSANAAVRIPVLVAWPGSPYLIASPNEDLVLSDLNNDGILDAAASVGGSGVTGFVAVLLTQPGRRMQAAPGSPFDSGNGFIRSIKTADFDRDGNMDIAGVNTFGGEIAVLRGDGTGHLAPAPNSPYTGGTWSWHMAVGDLNADALPDIAIADPGFGSPYRARTAMNSGFGDFPATGQTSYPVGDNPVDVMLVDLNNDHALDIVTANYNGRSFSVLLNDGSGDFSASRSSPVSVPGASPTQVAYGDFNEDGNQDVVVATWTQVSVILGDGHGRFSTPPVGLAGASSIAVGDLNGDGHADIVASASVSAPDNLRVFFGDGAGSFVSHSYGNAVNGMNFSAVQIDDLYANGRKEIVGLSSSGEVVVLDDEHIFSGTFE